MTAAERPRSGSGVALVVVDAIKAFFDPRGEFHYPEAEETLPGMRRLLEAARRGSRLVVHAHEVHRRGVPDGEEAKLPRHCLEGSLDAELVPGFEPLDGEVEIRKRRYSAFFATDLGLLLREHGIGQVVVAGVKTNVCIRATVQDAFAHGFEPVVVRGAVGSNRPHLHDASLEDVERYLGRVLDLGEGERLLFGEQEAAA
jgi:maleamate amidohydrolase